MRVLVVGGTGLIGGDAALRLAALGHEVAIAARNPAPAGTGMAAFEFLACDYLAGGLPRAQLARFDALVGHKEATGRLPDDAVLLARSAGCPVQVYRAGRHVYATQFHPEVSTDDFIARARVYRHHGYFPAHELDLLVARLGAASVTEPGRMLRRFVELAEARSLAAV